MGVIAERLDNLVVRVDSPDGQIVGRLTPDSTPDFELRGNAYRNYTERGLEHQLSQLIGSLWDGYQRGYDEAITAVTGEPVDRAAQPWDARSRRFHADKAQTKAKGMSGGQLIYLETVGMARLHVVIRDGALSQLDAAGFVAEFRHALRRMMAEYRLKVRVLQDKHFGPGIGGPRTRCKTEE